MDWNKRLWEYMYTLNYCLNIHVFDIVRRIKYRALFPQFLIKDFFYKSAFN